MSQNMKWNDVMKNSDAMLTKLKPLGTAAAVISVTMSALTALGWLITRKKEHKEEEEQ